MRTLSTFEELFYSVERCVCQNMALIVTLSPVIPEPVLRVALDMLQEKHPPLRWKIKDSTNSPSPTPPEFVTGNIPPIPLKYIKRENALQWATVIVEEQNAHFNLTEGPLARVVVLEGKTTCDILLVFCHIAADGMSAVPFIHDLLTISSQLMAGLTPEPLQPLPEPLTGIELLSKNAVFKPEPTPPPPDNKETPRKLQVIPEKKVPHRERYSRMIPQELSPEETRLLIERCKKEQVSVQAAVSAAALQALTQHYRLPEDGKVPLYTGCAAAIDLRADFVRPTKEDFGNYIAFARQYLTVDEHAPLWPAARLIKKSLDDSIAYGKHIKEHHSLPDVISSFATTEAMLEKMETINPPVLITNLGQLDIPREYGSLLVETISASGAMHAFLKVALVVVTLAAKMTINMVYSYPCLSDTAARDIADGVINRLKAV